MPSGVGYAVASRLLPRTRLLAGAIYGAGVYIAVEAGYRMLPERFQPDPPPPRVFREARESFVGLVILGALLARDDRQSK